MKHALLLFLFFFFCSTFYSSQAQELDSTMWTTDGEVLSIARSGNTIYLGGTFGYVGPRNCKNGALLNQSDGKLVQTPSLKIEGTVFASASDGQGGWYIGGEFNQVQGVERNNLAHISSTGKLDVVWKPEANNTVTTILLDNNTVYVGGGFTTIGGKFRNRLAALTTTTGQPTSWDANIQGNASVHAMAIANNTIYVSGYFDNIGGQPRGNIGAVDATTGLATAWNPNMIPNVYALAISNNTVFIGGYFSSIGGEPRNNLAALDATTAQVKAWNPSSAGNNVSVITRILSSNNTIYVSGGFSSIGGKTRNNLAALDATTGLATNWDANLSAFEEISSLTIANSTLFVAGSFNNIGGQIRNNIAALDATTGIAKAWNPGMSGGSNIRTLSLSGNSVFVGGYFASIGGKPRNRLAALDATTGQATAWNPNANNFVYALTASASTIYVGGNFTSVGGQTRNYLAALDAGTGQATDWNPNADRDVRTVELANNTVYVGGSFTSIGGQSRNSLAALDATTGQATAWNPNPKAFTTIHSITLSNNTIFVAGDFTSIGGENRKYLASLDNSTGQATAWNPDANHEVTTLVAAGNTIYAGGNFTSIGGKNRNYLAALDATSGQATAWNPNPDARIIRLAVSNNTIYAGGNFNTISGQKRNYLAGLDASSGQVTPWAADLLNEADTARGFMSLAIYNNIIYLGGSFDGGSVSNFAAFGKEGKPANFIQGTIYEETNGDCVMNSTEKGLPNRVLIAQPGNYFGSTDSLGHYSLAVDTGTYIVQQLLPSTEKLIQQVCPLTPAGYSVRFIKLNETVTGKDFGNKVTFQSSLTVQVSSSRRRRCFTGRTLVSYQNEGTANADSVKVYVQLPEHVVLVKATATYQIEPHNTYVFTIGAVAANGTGAFSIVDSVACGNPDIRGLTQCTKAWITPANKQTPPSNWDQSSIGVKAECQDNGFVRLGIYNVGAGNMADSSAFRIYLDAQLAFQNNFLLSKGDSLILRVPVNGKTLRLEADQRPNHPRQQQSHVTLEACGTNDISPVSQGFVMLFPTDDEDPQVSVECLPIIDSYDPNDKAVSPEGVTQEKYTPTTTPLEYTIRFQNTGTDIAYTVSLVDTLAEHLDVSTLQFLPASHPYTVQINGKGKAVLTWTFTNINLPDSATNQLGSNGYVRFSIKPKANLPEKTKIENVADIFFDYNPAVRTNITTNTLYDIPRVIAESVRLDQTVVCANTNLAVQAGANRAFCEQDTVVLHAMAPLEGQGTWKRISGSGAIEKVHDPLSKVTALGLGENVFEWSVPANSCESDFLKDSVTITRYPQPAKPVISLVGTDSLRSSVVGDVYQWYLEGTKLGNATRSIPVRTPGQYTVQVSDAHCSSVVSAPFHYIITGLEASAGTNWAIYPNPHAGRFTIELPTGLGAVQEIVVLDALGKQVLEQNPHSTGATEEIDFSSFASGTYFVKVQTAKGSFVKRMVKQ